MLWVKARGQRDLVTVVGAAAAINAGEFIQASGIWVNDRNHPIVGVLDVAVAEPSLDGAGVMPVVGEREAAVMAQLCGGMGQGRAGAGPITASCFLNPTAVIGAWCSVLNRQGKGVPARVAGFHNY